YRLVPERPDQEMCHPLLVLGAELVRAIDTAHPKDYRPEPIGPRVVQHVLLRRPLQTTVRTVQLEGPLLRDPELLHTRIDRGVASPITGELQPAQSTVDLVRGG